MRILIADYATQAGGQGGALWALRQYATGFRRLGHNVQVTDKPDGDFDLVINTSGLLAPDAIADIPIRVYLDLDPAFNQFWHEEGVDRRFDGHTHFVTVGQAIGRSSCEVPTHGLRWITTFPPVVLDDWPRANGIDTDALTTVANLRSYGSIQRGDLLLGQKVHSLRALISLPTRTGERFVLAMQVHPADRHDMVALAENGWEVVDPITAAGTPDLYHRFVQGSRAEIGIAKSGYVASRCGWFSDRSAFYLASGRPVAAQDTGFSQFVPTGDGLVAFDDEDSAVAAVGSIGRDYAHHSRAARELAEEFFDSNRVLTRLLAAVAD